ncbi:hypothetical protein MRX96_005616 [Rhipicephalus microplus]
MSGRGGSAVPLCSPRQTGRDRGRPERARCVSNWLLSSAEGGAAGESSQADPEAKPQLVDCRCSVVRAANGRRDTVQLHDSCSYRRTQVVRRD